MHRAIVFIEQLSLIIILGISKEIPKYYIFSYNKIMTLSNNCIYVVKLFKIHRIRMYLFK